MSYTDKTTILPFSYPAAGETSSSVKENDRMQRIQAAYLAMMYALVGTSLSGTVLDGFAISAGAGLSISVPAGWGMISGWTICAAGATAKAGLTNNSTCYIWLKKTATTDADRTFTVEFNTDGSPIADAIFIATATTAGGAVTAVDNSPTGRTPRIPYAYSGTGWPQTRIVAPSGGQYTSPKVAIEAASAGDIILLMPGAYTCTAVITVPANNITIMGWDRNAVVLNFTAADATHCINCNGKDGLTLSEFTLSAVGGKTGRGIYGGGCDDLLLDRLVITGADLSQGIYLYTSGLRNLIRDCSATTGGAQVMFVVNQTDISIRDCAITASGVATHGIYLDATTTRGRIAGNAITMAGASASGKAIAIYDWAGSLTLSRNSISCAAPGVWYAIYIKANSASTRGLHVNKNQLTSSGAAGTGITLVTTNPNNLDEAAVGENTCLDFLLGVNIADARVRYTLVHDCQLRSCTTKVSDTGSSTTDVDNVKT